jgi:calcium-dependent protein kinase
LKKNFLNIKMLRHPNIIRYHALYFDLQKHLAYLIMEYFPFKNLTEQVLDDEVELRIVFAEVLSAISYIHERNICHRDIKPENILYDPVAKRIKLIDFGISKRTFQRGQRRDMLTIIGTSQYLAPEILTGGGYDERVDMWSTGITLYRLISGTTPFESIYHSDTISSIIKGNITFTKVWDGYSFFVKDITLRMLKPRDERLTAKEALRHWWICQGSPGKMRKASGTNVENKMPRHDSFNLRVFKAFAEEENLNLKHAKSREEGEEQPEELRPGRAIRLSLIENKEFDLEDSGEEESSPSTGKSWEGKKKTWGSLF